MPFPEPNMESALKARRLPAFGVHDGAKLLLCSDELAEMFGASSAAEVTGRDFLSFLSPGERDQAVAAVVSADRGSYRSRGVRLDGSEFPIEISSSPICYRAREARLFTVRDLSPIALVVDDEAPVGRMTAVLLRLAGYQTAIYTSSRRALRDYWAGAASVIVSDIVMPELDGVAMVQKIRQIDADVPVIFVSGFASQPVPEDAATVFVRKPFVRDHLDRALAVLPARARAPLE
jgi:PAS domain S-box-containing protein